MKFLKSRILGEEEDFRDYPVGSSWMPSFGKEEVEAQSGGVT